MDCFLAVLFVCWCGFWNSVRGRKLYGLTDSTILGRLVATLAIALATVAVAPLHDTAHATILFLWTWATLELWATPAWDAYWGAEIGTDPNHSRLWGLGKMTLRMTLAMPCILGTAFLSGQPLHGLYTLGTLFLGLPYYIFGYALPGQYTILASELAVGSLLGFLIFQAMGG